MLLNSSTNALHSPREASNVLWHKQALSLTWISSVHWFVCLIVVPLAYTTIKGGTYKRTKQRLRLSEMRAEHTFIWLLFVSRREGKLSNLYKSTRFWLCDSESSRVFVVVALCDLIIHCMGKQSLGEMHQRGHNAWHSKCTHTQSQRTHAILFPGAASLGLHAFNHQLAHKRIKLR